MNQPLVVLVGAPNVGKSTLFNRLAGGRPALVHPTPGMTRDRFERPARVRDRPVRLLDTGGLVPASRDEMAALIAEQSERALAEADLVLLVTDGRAGCTATDRVLAANIRRTGLPVLVVVNKLDTPALATEAADFHQLGLEPVLPLSAEHGLGMADLVSAILERLPEPGEPPQPGPAEISLALIGRPNVGKSSLINRLVSAPRVIVSDRPGTTRDSVDILLRAHGRAFRLVDTAGLRRRPAAVDDAESLAIVQARRALSRAQVAVLVLDAAAGVTAGDLAVAAEAQGKGRALLPVLNKWDLVEPKTAADRRREAERRLRSLPHGGLLTVSAATGLRVRRILTAALASERDFLARRPTAAWNRALRAALAERRPPLQDGRPFRIYYAVQTGSGPPRLDLFCNRQGSLPEDYRRFLGRRLQAALNLGRTPILLRFRKRSSHDRRRPDRRP